MKKELLDEKVTSSFLGKLDTVVLLSFFVGTIIMAYFLAWLLRNHYDPKKLLMCYLFFVIPFFFASIIFQLNLVIAVGIYLTGGVIAVFRSNSYFYQ